MEKQEDLSTVRAFLQTSCFYEGFRIPPSNTEAFNPEDLRGTKKILRDLPGFPDPTSV